ncbi:MAG: FecCD family ABC transporter permease, partial [Candidatus Cryptobacteroides sp.]
MFRDSYRRTRARRISFILVCIVACLILSIYSVTIGPYPMTMGDVIDVLWNFITMQLQDDTTIAHIVLNLRLPRIIGGIICGFALAVCGAAMQSMMKNPLADPYTMGISSGAGFGAALAMILGIELIAGGGIVVNAFVFAVIPAVIILFLSRFRKATPTMMVLCGISLMYLFNALTQLFMLIADPDDM